MQGNLFLGTGKVKPVKKDMMHCVRQFLLLLLLGKDPNTDEAGRQEESGDLLKVHMVLQAVAGRQTGWLAGSGVGSGIWCGDAVDEGYG